MKKYIFGLALLLATALGVPQDTLAQAAGPVISGVVSQNGATALQKKIVWQTNTPSNSALKYSLSASGPYNTVATDSQLVTQHELLFAVGLDWNRTVYYYVESTDASGRTTRSPQYSIVIGSKPANYNPLEISEVTSSAVSNSPARKFTWKTNIAASSNVRIGTSPGVYVHGEWNNGYVTSHEKTVSGLYPGVTYYYTVRSIDGSGNTRISPEYSFVNQPIVSNPLTISNVAVESVWDGTRNVVWNTNIAAESKVLFGTVSGSYTGTLTRSGTFLRHSLEAAGWRPGTKYYYVVESRDAAGNVVRSPEATHTVPPAVVTPQMNLEIKSPDTATSYIVNAGQKFQAYDIYFKANGAPYTVDSIDVAVMLTTHGQGLVNPGNYITTIHVGDKAYAVNATNFVRTTTGSGTYRIKLSGLAFQIAQGQDRRMAISFTTIQTPINSIRVSLNGNQAITYRNDRTLVSGNATLSRVNTFTLNQNQASNLQITNFKNEFKGNGVIEFTWNTNLPSDSSVWIGTASGKYISSFDNQANVTSHKITVTGLTVGQKYYFVAESKGADGILKRGTEVAYTIPSGPITVPVPLLITNVGVALTGNSPSEIVWNTNLVSDSKVLYGYMSGVYLTTLTGPSNVTYHKVPVSGWTPGTTYYYVVESRDSKGNVTRSPEATHTVPAASTPLEITQLGVELNANVPSNIVWRTNKPVSESRIMYGTSRGNYTVTKPVTETATYYHRAPISGWTPGVTYFYAVESKGPDGVFKRSSEGDHVVMTKPVTTTPVTPPASPLEITNVNVTNNGVRTDSKRINWQTNRNSNSTVRYGQAPGVYPGTVSMADHVTNHSVAINGLWPGVKYYYVVESLESNVAGASTKRSAEYSFTMPTAQTTTTNQNTGLNTNPNTTSNVVPVAQNGTNGTGLVPSPAPKLLISSITAQVGSDRTKQVIQWQTNLPSDSVLKYGTTPGSYGNNVAYNGDRVTAHRMEIGSLAAGTRYYFTVESNDGKGGVAKSAETSFVTPAAEEPRRRVQTNSFQNYLKNAVANVANIFGN